MLQGRRATASNLVSVKLSLAGKAVAGSSSGAVTNLQDSFLCLDCVAVDFVSASSVSIPTNKIKALLTFF